MSNKLDTIVIGASAGGIEALAQLLSLLPADLPARICVVVHLSPKEPSRLDEVLGRAGPLPANMAEEGEPLRCGQIYVAPPDRHLLIHDDELWVRKGPRENRHRPAVDVLFRSAAVACGQRVIGIVLSGVLNDGTAGLHAIKQMGGITVVQDPEEAIFDGMPLSALKSVEVDYCVPVKEMAKLMTELTRQPVGELRRVPDELRAEVSIGGQVMSNPGLEDGLGKLVPVTCPECDGPLWKLTYDKLNRYRCHVGHAYTLETLLADQEEHLDALVWKAYRLLEEHIDLLNDVADDEESAGHSDDAERYRSDAAEAVEHVKLLRQFIEAS